MTTKLFKWQMAQVVVQALYRLGAPPSTEDTRVQKKIRLPRDVLIDQYRLAIMVLFPDLIDTPAGPIHRAALTLKAPFIPASATGQSGGLS